MNDGTTPPPPPPQDPNAGTPPPPPPPPVDPAVQQAGAPVPPPPSPAPSVPAQSAAPQTGAPASPPSAGQAPATGGASPLMSDEELSEDQFITGGDDHSFITAVPVPAHPNTQFDEKKFLALLAGSISLTKTEKQRIIASIPKLSQHQIDELIRIFTEEQAKFAELNNKHVDQLKALEDKHKNDWNDIEHQAKQEEAKKKDDEDADALRAKLGLN